MKTVSANSSTYSDSDDIPYANERIVPLTWIRIFRKIFNTHAYFKGRLDAIINASSELGSTIKESATTGTRLIKSTKIISTTGSTQTVFCSKFVYLSLLAPSAITINFSGTDNDSVQFVVPQIAALVSANLDIYVGAALVGKLGKDYGKTGELVWAGGAWNWMGTA